MIFQLQVECRDIVHCIVLSRENLKLTNTFLLNTFLLNFLDMD